MRNTIAYPTQFILTFSWYTLFSQTRKWPPSHSGITVSPGMKEMPSLNMPVQRLKVAILPLDLPCSGPVTNSGEILTTVKSHEKTPDRFSLNYNIPNYNTRNSPRAVFRDYYQKYEGERWSWHNVVSGEEDKKRTRTHINSHTHTHTHISKSAEINLQPLDIKTIPWENWVHIRVSSAWPYF